MSDEYSPVAVTAAAIAWKEFKSPLAEETLKRFIADENADLSLMAINYLLYCDQKQPFIESIKSVHDMPGKAYTIKAACMDFLGSLGLVPNNFENRE
jgi:hypothetical protein